MGQKLAPPKDDRALSWETVAQISKSGLMADYAEGARIHLRGDKSFRLSVIVSGGVSLSNTDANGRRIELARLSDGDMFGIHQALSGAPYTHDAYALSATRLVSFDRAALEALLETDRDFRSALLVYLSDRLVRALRMIETERRHPLCIRLAKYLHANRDVASGIVSGSQANHAEALGVSRNALGACLQQMARLGLLSIGRQTIHIPSPQRLSHWVEQEALAD